MNTLLRLIVALTATFSTGWIGKLVMADTAQSEWYLSLIKPAINPPSWIFGIVWPTLHTLIALAIWLVWKKEKNLLDSKELVLFFAHLPLNPLWIYLFFIKHELLTSVLFIFVLTLITWALALMIKDKNSLAFLLFLPYPLWLTFASFLNSSIYVLNS